MTINNTKKIVQPSKSALQLEPDYTEEYFSLRRDDPKREMMYKSEFSRIELLKNEGRVLDVGCGLGEFLELFPSNKWDRYGIDISEFAIENSQKKGITVKDFEFAYDYPPKYFDLIVFRGTIQHIFNPFEVIWNCCELLAKNGLMVFLATPNSNSPYYIRFKTLPFCSPRYNYLIPSDVMMKDLLINYGLDVIKIEYPYLNTPYANLVRDHFYFIASFLGIKKKFPFWRSSMEVYAQKKQ